MLEPPQDRAGPPPGAQAPTPTAAAIPGRGAPPLSVVLCCHGRPDYLGACLSGLAVQTRRDFETVVVDSASDPAARDAIAAAA
ncbi:MAG TPA: glycosyltransferase, partial [Crenalkalicoccus sp.]|nr:glycosyltransferase [Crenalkalicoccus sp.]